MGREDFRQIGGCGTRQEGGSYEPNELPLDPPLYTLAKLDQSLQNYNINYYLWWQCYNNNQS